MATQAFIQGTPIRLSRRTTSSSSSSAPPPTPTVQLRLQLFKPSSPPISSIRETTTNGRRRRTTITPQSTTTRRRLTIVRSSSSSSSSSETPAPSTGDNVWMVRVVRIGEALTAAFPLWVALACVIGLVRPSCFLWVHQKWQILGLFLTMLGMGMTLTPDDLRGALAMPKELLTGYAFVRVTSEQAFKIAFLLCRWSNIGRMLPWSELLSPVSRLFQVMTPFLTSRLAGQYIAVDAIALCSSTVQVVLAPVLAGAFLNEYCHDFVVIVSPVMPFIAVATVAILCGSAIAQNASAILTSGLQVVLSCCALHASGFFFGYVLSRTMGIDVSSSRTISIEVGMQNSVLGVVLAAQHFGNPLTTVPCAVSSVCHSLYGSILAGIWRRTPLPENKEKQY
ncbi:hypothetical protein QJS10_CPB11g01712 [Acorus calamus]|uniref:Sodium/metabolite cotransporter BASS1, chloroplastic n=1 Tax=Acorus calamus TaxID=4465 RepID=A0AAV9DVM3_ACOCL|nr:hypothetical protein QJS10_CPB11g01712 [Acorus calamus]